MVVAPVVAERAHDRLRGGDAAAASLGVAEDERGVDGEHAARALLPRIGRARGTSPGRVRGGRRASCGRACWMSTNASASRPHAARRASPDSSPSRDGPLGREAGPVHVRARLQPRALHQAGRHGKRLRPIRPPRRSRPGAARPRARRHRRSTHAQPQPVAIRSASRSSRLAAHAERGVEVGPLGAHEPELPRPGPARAPRPPPGPRRLRTSAACAPRATSTASGLPEALAPNARTLSSSRYRNSPSASRRRRPVSGRPAGRRRRARLARDVERAEDVLDRVERRAVDERGERPDPALVVGEEEVVAPGQRGRERALALRPPGRRVPQQREAVVEPPGDLGDRQRAGPRRGQLDGEREAVERAADLARRPARTRRRARTRAGARRPGW